MKTLFSFLLLLIGPIISFSQVTEINFLKKTWHVHGVDFRYGFPNFNTTDQASLLALDNQYQNEIRANYNLSKPEAKTYYNDHYKAENTVEVALVFKPFNNAVNRTIKSAELRHAVGFNSWRHGFIWDSIPSTDAFKPFGAEYLESSIYYNPSLDFSTPTFFGLLKAYGGPDLLFSKSFFNEYSISKNSSRVLYDIDVSTLDEDTKFTKDYYQMANTRFGAGYTVGLKLYLTCNTNLHFEFRDLFTQQKYNTTGNTYNNRNSQILFGFRYKFFPREEKANTEIDPNTVFW